MDAGEATGTQPLRQFFGACRQRQFDGKGDDQARIARQGRAAQKFGIDRFRRIVLHRLGADPVKQLSRPGKHQFEVVVQLRHGAHGGAAGAHRVGLVDGDGRGHALDLIHCRFVHAVQELARVGRKSLYIAPLAFCVQRVKDQAGFARTAGACDHGQFAGANVQVQVFEIVLPRSANADGSLGHSDALQSRGAAF